MDKEAIHVPVISDTVKKIGAPLSPVVRANGLIFVSGLPPIDLTTGNISNGPVEEQADLSLKALKHALEAAGSSMDKVVKTTVYSTNSAHFKRINEVYARHFSDPFPARTFVAVASWPLDFDVEIECIAMA